MAKALLTLLFSQEGIQPQHDVVNQLNQDDLWHPIEWEGVQDSSPLFLYQPDTLLNLQHVFLCCHGIPTEMGRRLLSFQTHYPSVPFPHDILRASINPSLL
jgi:hypothetical protein